MSAWDLPHARYSTIFRCIFEVLFIRTLNHCCLQSSKHIHTTSPQCSDKSAPHGVLIQVEADRRSLSGAALTVLSLQLLSHCLLFGDVLFYLLLIRMIVSQGGMNLR